MYVYTYMYFYLHILLFHIARWFWKKKRPMIEQYSRHPLRTFTYCLQAKDKKKIDTEALASTYVRK